MRVVDRPRQEELGANHRTSIVTAKRDDGVKTRSSESNIKSILNDAFSKVFRQNFLSGEQAIARRQKQGTKKQAQELPIATAPRSDQLTSPRQTCQILSDTLRWNDFQHFPATTAPSPIVIGVPGGGHVRLRSETTNGASQILAHERKVIGILH